MGNQHFLPEKTVFRELKDLKFPLELSEITFLLDFSLLKVKFEKMNQK